MSTLTDSPEYTPNEIYQIAQSDRVEGAASGASFGGIGVSNEPHQQLANRTALLKNRQDTNIANIGVLQAFEALFTSLMASSGYLQIPFSDVNLGPITAIAQWVKGHGQNITAGSTWAVPFSWPTPFPNTPIAAIVSIVGDTNGNIAPDSISVSRITPNGGTVYINNAGGPTEAVVGFTVLAIGY